MKQGVWKKIVVGILVFGTLFSMCGCAPKAELLKESMEFELGEEFEFALSDFFALEGMKEDKFAYDLDSVDLSIPGEYPVEITYGKQSFTVTLVVRDTTAPTLQVDENVVFTNQLSSYDAKDYVTVSDLQSYEITYAYKEKLDLAGIDTTLWDLASLGEKLLSMASVKDGAPDIEVSEDGVYVVEVTATDASDNATKDYMIVVYDKTAPEITDMADYEVQQENVEEEPQVDFSVYSVTDNLLGQIPIEKCTTQIKADEEKKQCYVISISYTDLCGNTTSKQANVTVKGIPKKTTTTTENNKPGTSTGTSAGAGSSGGGNSSGSNSSESGSSCSTEAATGSYKDDYANQVLALVNEERAAAGLAPLTMNSAACNAAKVRAAEIEVSFSHTRPSGANCFTALTESGASYGYAGENIAAGQSSPEAVVNAWMNSEGHRANILNANYTQIGIGCYYDANGSYRYYWVQLFIG